MGVFSCGQKLLLSSGEPILAADISVGDLLLGVSGGPVRVESVAKLLSPCVEVQCVRGPSIVIGDESPAFLSITPRHSGRLHEYQRMIPSEIRKQGGEFLHRAKMRSFGVEFPASDVLIDPYYLGVWLGDGHRIAQTITNPEPEILQYTRRYAESLGMRFSVSTNSCGCAQFSIRRSIGSAKANWITEQMRSYGIMGNKRVPVQYLVNESRVRMAVLAGLLDTDGSLGCGVFDYISVIKGLSEDVCFLARSVGLRASMQECQKKCYNNGVVGTYWRVCISGETGKIPTIVPRKIAAPRRQKKSPNVFGFSFSEPKEMDSVEIVSSFCEPVLTGDFLAVCL